WDVASGRRQRTLKGHGGTVLALAFSDDGATLVSSDARGVARLWDLSGPVASRRLTSDIPPTPTFHLAYSLDGRWLAMARSRPPSVLNADPAEVLDRRLPPSDWTGEVRLWDARTGRLVHRLLADPSHVYRVAFAPDGRTLATGGRDSVVRLWDVATGQLVRTLRGRPSDPLNYPQDVVGAPGPGLLGPPRDHGPPNYHQDAAGALASSPHS